MEEFQNAAAYLPGALYHVLRRIPDRVQDTVQEIRLRAGAPVILSTPANEFLVTQEGQVTISTAHPLLCDHVQLVECFQTLCEHSVHTHQQEIRNGYISTKSGCRAGIAGSAVMEKGEILSMRQITSICLRVARRHNGCAAALAMRLLAGGTLRSTLIAGEPSSGKTSLLKDLARQLSGGTCGKRYRTAVVDERGEMSGEGGLSDCDVLLYCPKGLGIQQAVRCLAPDVVIFDELGTPEEVRAVESGLNAGVAAIASVHCRDKRSLLRRSFIRTALEDGAFEQVVMLEGRHAPGAWSKIYDCEEFLRLSE